MAACAIRQIFLGLGPAGAGLGATVLSHTMTIAEEIAVVGALGAFSPALYGPSDARTGGPGIFRYRERSAVRVRIRIRLSVCPSRQNR